MELAEGGGFRLTPMGARLRTGAPGGLGPVAAMYAGPHFWATAQGLGASVRSGTTATQALFGAASSFDLYARDPALAAGFDAAMTAMSDLIGPAVAEAYPFAGLCVDVGGGEGRLIAHILAAHPGARGLVFDLPPVAAKARGFLERLGLSDRCAVAEGDMFTAVPPGGDVYLLSAVIHDWDDAEATRALANCRRAMDQEAGLLLVERVLREPLGPTPRDQADAMTDLMMMVRNGGRERTARAYGELLQAAGFEMLRIIPTAGPRALVEARPA